MNSNQSPKKASEKTISEDLTSADTLFAVAQAQRDYIQSLEKIIFFISHKLRQPIAHVLGLSSLLSKAAGMKSGLCKITSRLRGAAHSIDILTRELSELVCKKITKLKADKR